MLCSSMPFMHWETRSRQLDLDFFILLKFLLNLLDDYETNPSISSNLNQLPEDDMKFLWNSLRKSHSQAVLQFRDKGDQGIDEAEFLKYLRPEGRTLKVLSTDPVQIERPWSLSKDDLDIFSVHWQESKVRKTSILPRKNAKSPKQIHQALHACHQWNVRGNRDKMLADAYVADTHPLHMRRTLDQSYYYMLDNTRPRDRDQVVSRYGKRLSRRHPVMIMVDQLWMWGFKDTVITSFPQRQGVPDDDPDPYGMTDVFQSMLRNTSGVSDTRDLANRIIGACSGACFDTTKFLDDEFQFLEAFESSIGAVANAEAACYQRFTKSLESPGALDLSNIKEESELLREVKDILDELNMISIIFSEQRRISGWGGGLQTLEQNQIKINTMQAQASKTYESLKDLMDLRQKHANLQEARSARQQADETSKQGNTIMVFTIVTILFLPASFMASFFALAISQFPRDPNSMLELHYVVKYMLIFTAVVATFFIVMAFRINQIAAFLKNIGRKFQGKSPEAPIKGTEYDEDDSLDEKMQTLTSVEPVKSRWARARHPWSSRRRDETPSSFA
ncbi:hypothetical protein BDZ45DRAFT_421917 [Acephala macrosclerotiorum]|nr:hypothetical protein BDZ45DRAFT_421917 [Acephala macrosclerotiorum]